MTMTIMKFEEHLVPIFSTFDISGTTTRYLTKSSVQSYQVKNKKHLKSIPVVPFDLTNLCSKKNIFDENIFKKNRRIDENKKLNGKLIDQCTKNRHIAKPSQLRRVKFCP